MLETIKAELEDQASKPDFDTFYIEYMKQVQDEDIDNEVSYLFRRNMIDASNLSFVIEEDYKKLVDL